MRRTVRPCARWWRRALVAVGAVALLSATVPAARGDDQTTPPPEDPALAAAPGQAVVIINQHGDVTIAGDAERYVRACGLTPGCIAYWEEGIGPIIVVGADDIAGGMPPDGSAAATEPPEPAP